LLQDANCWASLAEGAAKCKGLQVLSLKGCSLGKLGEQPDVCAAHSAGQQQQQPQL
jgi:hypothetical protein